MSDQNLNENQEVFIDEAIELLRVAMRSQGLNQSGLAAKIGAGHPSTVSMALNSHKHTLTLRRLTDFYNALGYQPHISLERIS